MNNSLPPHGTHTEDDVYLTVYLNSFEEEINEKLSLHNRDYFFIL